MKHLNANTKINTTQTIISEFRWHLGKYWRGIVDRDHFVVVRKSFEDLEAGVFMNKKLFDFLAARALDISTVGRIHQETVEIERVMHGPSAKEQSLSDIVRLIM